MESIRQYWKRTDKVYLLLCIFSSTMAVLALASWAAKQGNGFATDAVTGQITGIGDYRRALVQAGAAGIGLVIALLLSCIDYRSLVKVWPVHVVLTWGLVLPTLFIRNVSVGPLTIGYNAGDTDNYSWYKLGGFTFQPTELAKISFILTFAMHLNNVRSHINEPKELAKLLLHLLVPIAIIHVQGDDGTAIIYGIIGCCMMFAAGLSWKYIIGAFAALAAAAAAAFAFFSDKIGKGYQWYRILAVIDPDNKTGWAPSETIWKNIIYQQQRGEIALGSGGIFGNGFFGGRYYSVPNAHNDFIFSWIGNAAGFVGCCVVLGVLLAVLLVFIGKTFVILGQPGGAVSAALPAGATDLVAREVSGTAEEVGEHVFATGTARLVVSADALPDAPVTVRLWQVRETRENTMVATLDARHRSCIFTNLPPQTLYAVTVDGAPDVQLTVRSRLTFREAFSLMLQEL